MELVPYNFTTERGWAAIQLETGQVLSPHYLLSLLFSQLKHMAEAHLGRKIENAVITVPRHVTDNGTGHVRFAAEEYSGFQVARVVDEQIAAAAAHGLHTKQGDGKVVLVLHVGGRTSHATIFKFDKGNTRLIYAQDDLFFGGEDFTARVVDHMVELVKQQHGIDIRQDRAALLRLTAACEQAKKSLSEQEETLVQVESLVDGVDLFSAPLTRAKFEELNRDLFERVMGLVDVVVMKPQVVGEPERGMLSRIIDAVTEMVTGRSVAAEARKGFVDEIVLAGGSCKIPKIRELVKDYFRGREPNGGVEPDEAVIRGTLLLSRPEAARYLEKCFTDWYGEKNPRFITFS